VEKRKPLVVEPGEYRQDILLIYIFAAPYKSLALLFYSGSGNVGNFSGTAKREDSSRYGVGSSLLVFQPSNGLPTGKLRPAPIFFPAGHLQTRITKITTI
jgi:hypothetical protein